MSFLEGQYGPYSQNPAIILFQGSLAAGASSTPFILPNPGAYWTLVLSSTAPIASPGSLSGVEADIQWSMDGGKTYTGFSENTFNELPRTISMNVPFGNLHNQALVLELLSHTATHYKFTFRNLDASYPLTVLATAINRGSVP